MPPTAARAASSSSTRPPTTRSAPASSSPPDVPSNVDDGPCSPALELESLAERPRFGPLTVDERQRVHRVGRKVHLHHQPGRGLAVSLVDARQGPPEQR